MLLHKSQICLSIFYELLNGKTVSAEKYMEKYGISLVTFKRDIQEIRAFFANEYLAYEVVYFRKFGFYKLVDINR